MGGSGVSKVAGVTPKSGVASAADSSTAVIMKRSGSAPVQTKGSVAGTPYHTGVREFSMAEVSQDQRALFEKMSERPPNSQRMGQLHPKGILPDAPKAARSGQFKTHAVAFGSTIPLSTISRTGGVPKPARVQRTVGAQQTGKPKSRTFTVAFGRTVKLPQKQALVQQAGGVPKPARVQRTVGAQKPALAEQTIGKPGKHATKTTVAFGRHTTKPLSPAPAAQQPTVQQQAVQQHVAQQPAAQQPAAQQPVAQQQAVQQPAAQQPAAQQPAAQQPAAQQQAVQQPVAQQQAAAQQPVAQQPAAQQQAGQQPAAQQPAAQQPVAQQQAVQQPVVQQPVAQQQAGQQPAAQQPAAQQPVAQQPVAQQQAVQQPVVQQPVAQQQAGQQPAAQQQAAQQPAVQQPAAQQPAAQQPAAQQPAAQQPAAQQQAVQQPVAQQQAAAQQPAGQQPVAQQPAVQQPAVQQPAVQQPAVQQPAVQQPAAQQPAAQQPVAQQPVAQQQAVQQPVVAIPQVPPALVQALQNARDQSQEVYNNISALPSDKHGIAYKVSTFVIGQGHKSQDTISSVHQDVLGAMGNASRDIGNDHSGRMGAINAFSSGLAALLSGGKAISNFHEAQVISRMADASDQIANNINSEIAKLKQQGVPNDNPQLLEMTKISAQLHNNSAIANKLKDQAVLDGVNSTADFLTNSASTVGGMMQFAEFARGISESTLNTAGSIVGGAAGIATGTIGAIRDGIAIHENYQMEKNAKAFINNPFQAMLNKNNERINTLDSEISALTKKLAQPAKTGIRALFSTSRSDLQKQLDLKIQEKGLLTQANTNLKPKSDEYAQPGTTPARKAELEKGISELKDVASQIKEVSNKAKWVKAFSFVKNIVTVTAGIALVVVAATAAATPVGWAIGLTAAGIGLGLGIAKVVMTRQAKNEIKNIKNEMSQTGTMIQDLRVQIQTLDNKPQPLSEPDRTLKANLTSTLEARNEKLGGLEKQLRQKDPEFAAKELLVAINSSDPDKAEAARHIAQYELGISDVGILKVDTSKPESMALALKYLSKKMPSI